MSSAPENRKIDEKAGTSHRLKGRFASVSKRLEKSLPGWLRNLREPKWQRWALIVGTSLIAAFIMAPTSFEIYSLSPGEPAKETIISPITFQVIDEAATNKNRDEALKSVLPVYDFDDDMVRDVQARIISAFTFVTGYLAQEREYRAKQSELQKAGTTKPEDKVPDKKRFRPLDDKTLRTRFENLLGASVPTSTFALFKARGFDSRIQRDLRSLVVPVLLKGVVVSLELVMRDGKKGILLLPKSTKKLELLKDPSTIFDLKEAINYINSEGGPGGDTVLSRAIRRLAMDLINVNITYDRERSAALKREALESVKEVYFQVKKGEPIIKEGDPVNEGHMRKLEGLLKANPPYSRYMILAGFALLLTILLRLCFYFSERHLDSSSHSTEDLLLFCLLLVASLILVRFIASLGPLAASAGKGLTARSLLYAAPVATGSMLVALMVNARMAFIFAALSALTTVLALEGDVYLYCYYFVAGIVGLHGMSGITDRNSILRAGLVVGVVNMVSILAVKMALGQLTAIEELYELGFGFVGGVFSGLLVLGLAPLLEPLGYTTNVRLLELANFNHPLLKHLSMEAPGTYHHSIIVGNLAEAAAQLIGANPLLARVGAYYHDIGKVGKKAKPGYFIENQQRGFNPHDKLEPSMSALILVSHVKHGVEKAREYKLGTPIIDIIQQHHGTNLIRYFYNKAQERAGKDHNAVSEDKYHYPGPRPQTKESALVMMADVVEAACRTLNDPTPARIQKRVQTLIMGLFSDGQLDQSTLTLKDLHAVTKSFVRALQGILHTRVEYPRESKAGEKTNGDTAGQQTEKARNKNGRFDQESGTSIRRLGL
jgi:putative nucleotidyltransferase with HDIG domain